MADNSIVQTIKDAEIDARSLSEFISKDASFTVTRRLAPTIHTLAYYISVLSDIKEKGDLADIAISNTLEELDRLEPTVIQRVEDAINNTAIEGGVLADSFVTATANGVGTVARTQRDKNSEHISIKDFGAKGDGDQTTYTVPEYNTGRNSGYKISTQTTDAIAFNKAIRYLRSVGGGSLYIPKGVYYVYGYLEVIDFPCYIYGDGSNSIIKNCDLSPTDKHGYGLFVVQPKFQEEVTFSNLKLDGNAHVRSEPTSEFQLYPLIVYGIPRFRMSNVSIVNSPIDCFTVTMDTGFDEEGVTCFAKITDCYFEDSYRNTVTVSKGHDIVFNGCTVKGGGFVYNGTNPRYCVDVEPNHASAVVKSKWINCTFSHARNVLVGGVWSDSMFTNCTFDGSFVHPYNADRPKFPWLFQFTAGQWDIDNCKFIGRSDFMRNECHHYNAYGTGYNFTDDTYLRIKNSTWIHSGVISTGRSISIENCYAQLSMCPFLFIGGTAAPTHDIFIKNLRLSNVFDGENQGAGALSSFTVASSVKGVVDIDGLTTEVDSRTLPKIPKELFTQKLYMGVYLRNLSSDGYGYRRAAKNVHSEGYYKRIPAYLGLPENATSYRDWGSPNSAPSDTQIVNSSVAASVTNGEVTGTVVDGVLTDAKLTNKEVTGTAIQTTSGAVSIGSLSDYYYRGCTMWGNYE